MIGKGILRVAICAALLLVAQASHVYAQACLGVPIGDGGFAPQFTIGLQDNVTTFRGDVTANLAGPLSLQGAFAAAEFDGVEDKLNTFGAQAAYEIPGVQFSACPFVGGGYQSATQVRQGLEIDANGIVVPVGIGLGKTVATGPNTAVTFFGTPRVVYTRIDRDLLSGGVVQTSTSSDTEFVTDLGMRFGLRSAFIGGAVSLDTEQATDTIVLFTIGFGLGGRR